MRIEEFGTSFKYMYIAGLVAGAALCEVDYYIQDAAISTGVSSSVYNYILNKVNWKRHANAVL